MFISVDPSALEVKNVVYYLLIGGGLFFFNLGVLGAFLCRFLSDITSLALGGLVD